MTFTRLLIVLFMTATFFTNITYPNDKEINKDDLSFYDLAHTKLSKGILGVSRRIDRFFSGERADDFVNKSQIRFTTITTKSEAPGLFTEGRMRLNLILPGTQDKLQLVIEGQGDDFVTQGSQQNTVTQTDDATSTVTNVQNTTTAAFRFLTEFAGIRASADSGVRINIPPNIFGRLRLWKQVDLQNNWIFRPRQEVFWMDNEGFQSTLNLDFDKQLDNNQYLFRFINRALWNDLDYKITYTNGPSLFYTIDDQRGLSYHANVVSEKDKNTKVVNYILRVSYRQLLYQNWLFGELSPQLEFPRSQQFRRSPSIALKFEVVMGSI